MEIKRERERERETAEILKSQLATKCTKEID